MPKPILVNVRALRAPRFAPLAVAAAVSALAISACGGAAHQSAAAICQSGKAVGTRFDTDLQQWAMAAEVNPVTADTSHVRRDLAQLSGMVTTLSHEDTNPNDLERLAGAKRGVEVMQAALAQLHTGNVVGYIDDLKRAGGEDLGDLAGGRLAICTSVGV